MPLETTRWAFEREFTTPESHRLLLEDALESGDAGHIANVLSIIARAPGAAGTEPSVAQSAEASAPLNPESSEDKR